jgi:hypothetical protein
MPRAARSAAKLLAEAAGLSTARGRLIAISALVAFLGLLGPRRLEAGPSLCLFRHLLGHPCPACGMTRAMAALARGQLRSAGRYNRLIYPAAFTLLIVFAQDAAKLLSQRQKSLKNLTPFKAD